jgi:hypothetical protein
MQRQDEISLVGQQMGEWHVELLLKLGVLPALVVWREEGGKLLRLLLLLEGLGLLLGASFLGLHPAGCVLRQSVCRESPEQSRGCAIRCAVIALCNCVSGL